MSQWVILAVVAVIVVCGGLALLRSLGSGVSSQPLPVPTSPSTSSNPSDGSNPGTDTGSGQSSTGGPQLGKIVTASSIGQKNAPGNVTNTFPSDASVIYVVIEGTSIPQGSTFFARWFRDNQPFEDSPQITADKDYNNTYIEFHLQPQKAGALQPGNYGVQIFVNGNPGPSTAFTVQ